MHKIDTDTAVGNEFVDGNAAASIKATRLNAKWFNTIQRELCNIVEQAGMALSENDDGQVLRAVLELVLRTLSAGLLKQIKLKGGYTIEIDSDNGTISIFDPEGSAGISFGFNDGSKFSFTDDVSFEGGADIMGSAKVGGKVVVKDEEDNGVEIANTGITFGQDGATKISVGSVETNQVKGTSGAFTGSLSAQNGSFSVTGTHTHSKLPLDVKNDASVAGNLSVGGVIYGVKQITLDGQLIAQQVSASNRLVIPRKSEVTQPATGCLAYDFGAEEDTVNLYVYDGRRWRENSGL